MKMIDTPVFPLDRQKTIDDESPILPFANPFASAFDHYHANHPCLVRKHKWTLFCSNKMAAKQKNNKWPLSWDH